MINYRKKLYDTLKLSCSSVYPDVAKDNPVMPYVVFTEDDREFDYTSSGIFESVQVTVDVYHHDRKLGAQLVEDIIARITGNEANLTAIVNPAGVDVDGTAYIFAIALTIY